MVLFPDAKTERGVKHVGELIEASKDGYVSYILFVVQMDNVKYFKPNIKMHQEFGDILKKASLSGVNIISYDCNVSENSITINEEVKVIL